MFGKIETLHFAILLISVIAIMTDLIWGRIFNVLTLPSALLGLIASVHFLGWTEGLTQSILGLFAGLILYGWLFGLRIIGGGDVKLLMAFGAWGGYQYAFQVALLGLLLGGVFSVFILLFKGKLFGFFKRMQSFLISVIVKELDVEPLRVDKNLTMPFGIPISLAAVWITYGHPFEQWGLSLW
jgi:prepilin peptidase CpaA